MDTDNVSHKYFDLQFTYKKIIEVNIKTLEEQPFQFLNELKKTDKVGDNNLVDLLRYYQLVNEIKIANGSKI